MRTRLAALAVLVIGPGPAPAFPAPTRPETDPARAFAVTCRREGTDLKVTGDRDRAVFEVRTDIGGAVIRRKGAAWPRTVVVRLYLGGLEGFQADTKKMSVGREAAVRRDEYYEVQLPNDFFAGNPESFKLEWVDFYRR